MDKVLKQRLVGASILIALAVIFLPMLFDGGENGADEQRELAIDVPERESGDRQVRRLALDPDQARRPPSESQAQPPEEPRPDPALRRPEPQTVEEGPEPGRKDDAGDEAADEAADAGADMADEPASDSDADADASGQAPAESADEAEGKTETTPEMDAADGSWVVQVAVFSNRETANAIRQRLGDLGHRVSLDVLIRDQAELFRLRTGPYADEAAAEQARGQIAATVAGVDPVTRELSGAGAAEDRHGLAVQVGSFASRNNAERLVGQLTEAGFDAFMYGEETGGRTIWRVRVGIHQERAAAESLLQKLRDEEGLEGIVVSHP